jgi:hypothetical protein
MKARADKYEQAATFWRDKYEELLMSSKPKEAPACGSDDFRERVGTIEQRLQITQEQSHIHTDSPDQASLIDRVATLEGELRSITEQVGGVVGSPASNQQSEIAAALNGLLQRLDSVIGASFGMQWFRVFNHPC